MSRVLEVLEKAQAVKPIARKNGKDVVSFEDAVALSNAEGFEPSPKIGVRKYNPDGSPTGIRARYVAINPDKFFANRYAVKGKAGSRKMLVVVDGRAIDEQARSKCPWKTVPAYVFTRDAENQLYISGIEMVSDEEFLSDFTNILDNANMSKLAPMIANYGADTTTSELPI